MEQTKNISIADISKEQLLSKGFRIYRERVESGDEIYSYRFPLYKYKKYTVLECEFLADLDEREIRINVYDANRMLYPPFYHPKYGNYTHIYNTLNQTIQKKIQELQIVKTM